MLREGYPEREVADAIRRLRSERYLDDARYAERFARSRIADHGLGRNRVRDALRRKGVPRAVAESGLAQALDDVSETGALDALARRYWRQRAREEPARRLRKLWVFLLRRGHPAGLVRERLLALWPRLSDALDGLEPEQEDTPS